MKLLLARVSRARNPAKRNRKPIHGAMTKRWAEVLHALGAYLPLPHLILRLVDNVAKTINEIEMKRYVLLSCVQQVAGSLSYGRHN